jgi:hypothetical protein
MKIKLMVFILLTLAFYLYSDLQIDIPYDTNLVGQSYAENGPYTFTGDVFNVTNLGMTDTFTIQVFTDDLPEGWMLTWCYNYNEQGGCLPYVNSWEFIFENGTLLELDPQIIVNSADSFSFYFLITAASLSEPVQIDFTFSTEDAAESHIETILSNVVLKQNYPNPFNPNTTISFNLSSQNVKNAELEIFNIKGQKISRIPISEKQTSIVWNGTDQADNPVSSGMYFYQISGVKNSPLKKMILIK